MSKTEKASQITKYDKLRKYAGQEHPRHAMGVRYRDMYSGIEQTMMLVDPAKKVAKPLSLYCAE